MIDESDVQAYVRMPDCLIKGCSDDMAIFIADGGNHFTDYVIYEGMFLFFGLNKPFLKGRLATVYKGNIIKFNNGLPILRRDTAQTRLRAVFL